MKKKINLNWIGKEYMIDMSDFNKSDKHKLIQILTAIYHESGWPENPHRGRDLLENIDCILRDNIISVSIHCTHEDNDFKPDKGTICCLNYTYEDESETDLDLIIPINGREFINQYGIIDTFSAFDKMNENEESDEFEWAKDILKKSEIDLAKIPDFIAPIGTRVSVTGYQSEINFTGQKGTIIATQETNQNMGLYD